jgi:hypothetical protein
MDRYYRVLGISAQSSVEELKKAYRHKAKLLHPDRNKHPDAHENFILLNEAYEYLLKLKTGNIPAWTNTSAQVKREHEEREKAKARAQEYARMRYEEFVNSPHYRSLVSLSTVLDYLYAAFGIVIFLVVPVVVAFSYGASGVITVLLLLLVTLPAARYFIRFLPSVSFRHFFSSLFYIIRQSWFLAGFLTLFNVIVLLKIGLQTLLPINLLFSGIALLMMVSFVLSKRLRIPAYRSRLYSFCILPGIVSLFFALNFLFSSGPVRETYRFYTSGSTFIHLDENRYEPFAGIRVFMSYDEVRFNNTITYTFERGLFGIRVMTRYTFSRHFEAAPLILN